MIKLGQKLENPYSVDNMRKAYDNLKKQGLLKSSYEIKATHIYFRFLPESDEELDRFENELITLLGSEERLEDMEDEFAFAFFDYPLDYEIEEGGTYYYDPLLPPGGITWQYAAVPVEIPLENRRGFERLEYLYMVDEQELSILKSTGNKEKLEFWNLLETEALKLTGDPDAENILKSSWRPSGKITVWDDVLQRQIPVHGAKVRARRWFTTHRGITDIDGNFRVDGTFKRPANYSIVWERANWDIREGWMIQAYYNGPKQQSPWNLAIGSATNTNKSMRYATIHRAAHRFFYSQSLGLLKPTSVQKIAYLHESGEDINGDYWSWTSPLPPILPTIRVYKANGYGVRKTHEIFSTTIHELAHAAHLDWMGNLNYWQVSTNIRESWAVAVQWALTIDDYKSLGVTVDNNLIINTYNNTLMRQYNWPLSNLSYSPLFIDLVDNLNQKIKYGGNLPDDNVSGYNMAQLNLILLKSYGLSSFKQEVKSKKPVGVTDAQLDLLFKRYEEIW